MSTISIVAAISDNNAIGKNLGLLWRMPADMKRFKDLTTGHAVILSSLYPTADCPIVKISC